MHGVIGHIAPNLFAITDGDTILKFNKRNCSNWDKIVWIKSWLYIIKYNAKFSQESLIIFRTLKGLKLERSDVL